jgi:hypothetical protein
MEIKNYGTHIVVSLGNMWISFDRTGIMTWNGTRNHFFIFKKPSTRLSRFFHN